MSNLTVHMRDTPQVIIVKAVNDSAREGTHYSRIVHTVQPGSLNNFLGVTIDNVAAGLAGQVSGNVDSPFTAVATGDTVTITGPAFRFDLGTPYLSATVTLGGAAAEGETWALVINGKTWSHNVDAGETVEAVAAKLRTLINGHDGLSVTGSGKQVTITAGSQLVTVGFLLSGSSAGTAAVSGTALGYTEVTASSNHAWTVADIKLVTDGATRPAGSVWTINLDGIEFRYTSKLENEDLTAVAAGLADLINQGGTRFAANYVSATVKLAGTPNANDLWTLTATHGTVIKTFSYKVIAGDSLIQIANELAAALGDGYQLGPTSDLKTDSEFTFNRADGDSFSLKLSVTGLNLQSSGQVSGKTAGARLVVSTADGTPFTASLRLAQSASQVSDFKDTGQIQAMGASGSASTESATHYSKLVLKLASTTLPIVQGAGWNLALGTRTDRVALDFSGAPKAGELWTLRLSADSWIRVATHLVQASESLQAVIDDLGSQIGASGSGYAVRVAIDDGDPAAPADDGTRLVTIDHMGSFGLAFTIAPAAATATDARAVITSDQASFAFSYVAGSNREVTVPDSLDVTVIDNDAPGVLILQSGGSTDVIEPTDIVRLGSGFASQVAKAFFRIGLGPNAVREADQTWTVYLVRANTASNWGTGRGYNCSMRTMATSVAASSSLRSNRS
jgi:hypothetical protein